MGNTTGQGQPPISSCLHCLHYFFKGSKRGAHIAKLPPPPTVEAATAQDIRELVWANLHHVFLLCTMHQQQPLCSAWGILGATEGKSTFCWGPGASGPNALTSGVQLLSHVRLFVTPWTAAHQASLSFTISQSLLKFTFIELVMISNHLILYSSNNSQNTKT